MKTLTLELPTTLYEQLHREANRLGKSATSMIQEWMTERLAPSRPTQHNTRLQARQALRAAGLLREITVESPPSVRLEDVQAAFTRAGGKPLSEILQEQRGVKV